MASSYPVRPRDVIPTSQRDIISGIFLTSNKPLYGLVHCIALIHLHSVWPGLVQRQTSNLYILLPQLI